MSTLTRIIFLLFFLTCLIVQVSANATTFNTTYLSEETAVPFELFILLIILGVVFLGLGIALSSPMHIVVVSLMGMMFLAAAAFVSPVVGFFNYEAFQITNATTGNVSMTFIPSVSLVAQPWVSWLLWGMFLVGLINLGVRGVGGWWMEAGQKKDEWER